MSGGAVWIGDCRLDGTQGKAMAIRAAARADGIAAWQAQVRNAVESQGWRWLGSVEVMPAEMWVSAHPGDSESASLARAVDSGQAMAFGVLREVENRPPAPEARPDDSGITLKMAQTAGPVPLDAQMGIWPKKRLPDGMEALLFGPAGKHGRNLKTYVILDAGRIPLLPVILGASGLPHACLFADVEQFGRVSPWIAEVTPKAEILRNIFTARPANSAWWDVQPALFLRSSSGIEGLRAHLARLVKVRSDAGPPLFFRFWEPEVAFGYMEGISAWPERIATIFWSRHARIDEIVAPSALGKTTRRFVLDAPGEDLPQPPPFILTGRDRDLLAQAHAPKFEVDLADWLVRADRNRFRAFGPEYRLAIARHAISEGREIGFTYKEEFSYFLYMMFFLGGWFHKSPHYRQIARGLWEAGEGRYGRMRHGFPTDYNRTFGGAGDPMDGLEQLRSRISERLAARGGWERIEPEDALSIAGHAERLFSVAAEDMTRTRELARTEAEAIGLTSRRDTAIFYAFWLTLGAWFHRDPLFPWAGEKLMATGKASEGLLDMAAYAMRRIDRTLSLHQRTSAHAKV